MRSFLYPEVDRRITLDDFLARVARLTSSKKVRPVVTPSGQRARGNFPSIRARDRARFESLVERDVLRVLEMSSMVRSIATHPFVLDLSTNGRRLDYTPDVTVETDDSGALVEAKAAYFMTLPPSRERLRRIVSRLHEEGLRLVIVLDQDVRPPGFQTELAELLRQRPRVGRFRPSLDTSVWDPLGTSPVDHDVERRWAAAQEQCDALLARVMRRDPDELFEAFAV